MGRGKQFCLLYVALLLIIVAIFESFAQCRPIEEAAVKDFVGQGDRGPGLVDSIERPARGRDLLQRRSLPSLTDDERETREEERANNETNPFVDDPLVCCCQRMYGTERREYQQPEPVGCCCGTVSECCPQESDFGVVCGSGQVCGILLLMSALVGTLVVAVCITGVFLARRRRRRDSALDLIIQSSRAHGAQIQIQRPGSQMIQIPNDQLDELYIGKPKAAEEGETKECPICLDPVCVDDATWAAFPCGHGCCQPCAEDLLRHSSRQVNATTVAVLCPLCRKIAVAPKGDCDGNNNAAGVHVVRIEEEQEGQTSPRGGDQPQDAIETPVRAAGDLSRTSIAVTNRE